MTGIAAVAVVIPAHNEQALLPVALEAVARSARHPAMVSTELIVVVAADACTDATRSVAAQGGALIAPLRSRNPGRARAVGTSLALRTLGLDPATVWIASTDADSEVPSRWLAHQRARAEEGWDAVVGTVRPQGWHPGLTEVIRDHIREYDSVGRCSGRPDDHPHVHGANLGVRADAYLRCGGYPALATGEDRALVAALRTTGHRVLRTRRFPVLTSARLSARARDGYGDHLGRLAERVRTLD
ncbi:MULTISPECIES: glycosyltransferase [Streptomyces]|uniref:4,4'-diaponeurosporenoate glycosyltransferase n=1 Tax=Streptomyces clavifer TaxID=68188 RepID=A0ABS4VJ56_9ACTN|nr:MULTISPECIES: glycosyltransferase [Streptomyces]KQZ19772.1 glycosyl transferase [Streptomyces sp. Root55]MBP2363959.1 glycosyltransferase involved in cell wall biosynthesis [Streptomyces clavifer]MDX2744606.1 glycosyltransferase [Streptomyces sp. NRRL_B-2557]MDX3063527.1 glycosyltransferase [Streptomyces sp. ND04-05B]RPK85819.1 Glycosyl transferase family 2 [Streptomyces sp. ADI97-07]